MFSINDDLISDHGCFGAMYLKNGTSITQTQAIYEKIDNIIDAHKRKRNGQKKTQIYIETFKNGHGVMRDNLPMSLEDMDHFRSVFRKATNVNNNIGTSGNGGKIGDYLLSKYGRTIIVSKKRDDKCFVLTFDWLKVKDDYDRKMDRPLRNNITFRSYNNIDVTIENNDFDFSDICIEQIRTHLKTPGTLCYYEDPNFKENITLNKNLAKDIGRTYYKVLEKDKIDIYLEGEKIVPFDIMHKKEIKQKQKQQHLNYYDSYELRVSYCNDCFYIDTIDLKDVINNKKRYFKWNTHTKRQSLLSNLPKQKVQYKPITIEMCCMWPINHSTQYKGVHINRCGKHLTTIDTSRNEYCSFRVQISYDDTRLDDLFKPGINKGTAQLTSTVKTLGDATLKGFRKKFPDTKKEYEATLLCGTNPQRTTESIQVDHLGVPDEGATREADVVTSSVGSANLEQSTETSTLSDTSILHELEETASVNSTGVLDDGVTKEVDAGAEDDGESKEPDGDENDGESKEPKDDKTLCSINTCNVSPHIREYKVWAKMTKKKMFETFCEVATKITKLNSTELDDKKKLNSISFIKALMTIQQNLLNGD